MVPEGTWILPGYSHTITGGGHFGRADTGTAYKYATLLAISGIA